MAANIAAIKDHRPATLIRVMVVDDHAQVREGLRMLLSTMPDMEVCCESDGGLRAFTEFLDHHPDVVLIDAAMPGADCIVLIEAMKRVRPDIRIITLSFNFDGELSRRALEAGAFACLIKEAGIETLVQTIRAARPCVNDSPMTYV